MSSIANQVKAPVDRIALDTSLWLKALLFGGSAEELINLAMTGKVEILTTETQFTDLARVLSQRLDFSETAIAEVRNFIASVASIVTVTTEPAAGPGDEMSTLLRAARDSKATAIATSDSSKLNGLKEFEGIPIVTVS
ncbi:MAG: putative PIN family toxin of toxin-antitoxin system [Planctomycetota bacterium]|jgi:putative PIN family toxin of toxin-antitoxin system